MIEIGDVAVNAEGATFVYRPSANRWLDGQGEKFMRLEEIPEMVRARVAERAKPVAGNGGLLATMEQKAQQALAKLGLTADEVLEAEDEDEVDPKPKRRGRPPKARKTTAKEPDDEALTVTLGDEDDDG